MELSQPKNRKDILTPAQSNLQMPEASLFVVSGVLGVIFKFLPFLSPLLIFPPAIRLLFPIFLFMFYVLSSVLI